MLMNTRYKLHSFSLCLGFIGLTSLFLPLPEAQGQLNITLDASRDASIYSENDLWANGAGGPYLCWAYRQQHRQS